MSDYIKRADAIDACCRGWNNTAEDCIRNIKALPSADAEPKWNCTATFVAEQLERLRNMTDEEKCDFFIKFFSPSADAMQTEEKNRTLGSRFAKVGGDVGNISRCLNTDKSDTHKGFHFERVV